MKKLLLLAVALIASAMMFAQEIEFAEFNETTHDFGDVNESVGKVSTVFTFKNLLQTPITITNVKTSCGCTTPAYSTTPIAPTEEGEVTVTYSARGRIGSFTKSITITFTNGTETFTKVFYIKGRVYQDEPTSPVGEIISVEVPKQ